MKNKIRWKLLLPFVCAMIVIFFCGSQRLDAKAGFGDFNDYDSGSDWGGSDWDSGGSDWSSSDDDYDWDSSDDDWSSSNDSWGSNSDNYVAPSSSSSSSSSDDADWLIVFAVVVAIVVVATMMSRKKGKGGSTVNQTGTPAKGLVLQHNAQWDAKTFPNRNTAITDLIHKTDPNFSADDFIAYVKNIYMDIQDAWSKRDLEPVRAVLHENLYAQTEKQVAKKKSEGIINALESIAIGNSYMTAAKRDDGFEYVTVYLVANMIDYQYKEDTGEVIRGNKTTRWELAYRMRLMRARGSVTKDPTKMEGHLCPNCGAALPSGASVVCPYCGSNVTTSKNEWVLCEFGTVRKEMTDEGLHWDSANDIAKAKALKAAQAQQTANNTANNANAQDNGATDNSATDNSALDNNNNNTPNQ